MLQITTPQIELWDEETGEFIVVKSRTLQLEHSLVSVSKWESTWHKPFLGKAEKTTEEILDYVRCMTLTQNVDPNVYKYLSKANQEEIGKYIDDPMTATVITDDRSSKNNRQIVTSEVIYSWMVSLNIPVEFQKWHLNRLLTLIRTHSALNQPPKKRSKSEIMSRNAALNAARKKQLNTRG